MNQLDAALAQLADKLGSTVEQLGPEVVKSYGGQLHAQAHLYGAACCWMIAVAVVSGLLSLIFGEDGAPAFIALFVVSLIVLLFCGLFYFDAAVSLAAYTASPVGATAMHLVGK